MPAATFDVIPAIYDRSGARLTALALTGVSTKHGDTKTDRGRMYAAITPTGGNAQRLDIYSDFTRTQLVASGESPAPGTFFALAQANASGITGRARLDGSVSAAPINATLVVSLSVDEDVFQSAVPTANMPGYDPAGGLAAFHAAATRRILTSDLPAAAPALFASVPQNGFLPSGTTADYPDLRELQNADALRAASAALAKALSAEEKEHVAEFADMAERARGRFAAMMLDLRTANEPEQAEAETRTHPTVQFADWIRV